jgi:thiol-disulfide isomerase/thioredoxin
MNFVHRSSAVAATLLLQSMFIVDAFAQVPAAVPRPGRLTVEQVRAIVSRWKADPVTDFRSAEILPEFRRLRAGATVRVFLGTWCDDSMYELPKFVRLLDGLANPAPFVVEFFAVDVQKEQPRREVKANDIVYLPTFIVLRNRREVGRIVEHPPRALEQDLLALLNGEATGLLSSNENAIVRYLTGGTSIGSQ